MISDPDLFTREGVRQMLSQYDDIEIVIEATNPSETLRGLQENAADVCILGIDTSRRSTLGFLRQIRPMTQTTPVLAIGRCHERDFALRAIRAGAAGYLPKACTSDQLADAIRIAACHRPYVTETVCDMIAESIVQGRATRQYDKLSDTDFEIFCLMAAGLSSEEIADACRLSVAMVRSRRSRIKVQTSFQNDAALVEYAIRRRLIGQAGLG